MKKMTFFNRVKSAIEQAETLDDIEYIEDFVNQKLDRRKKDHREVDAKINNLITEKVYSPKNNIIPFIWRTL